MSMDGGSGADEISGLIARLSDPAASVRGKSAVRLGELKEGRAVPALIALLDDNDGVFSAGQYAAWALGEIGDARAVEPLLAVVEQPYVGDAAIGALVKFREARVLEPILRIFRKTSRPDLATVLGNWGDPRAVEPLIAAMQNPDSHVRYYAARALGKIGDDRALPVLEWAQANDRSVIEDTRSLRGKSVSYAAARAIAAIKSGSPV